MWYRRARARHKRLRAAHLLLLTALHECRRGRTAHMRICMQHASARARLNVPLGRYRRHYPFPYSSEMLKEQTIMFVRGRTRLYPATHINTGSKSRGFQIMLFSPIELADMQTQRHGTSPIDDEALPAIFRTREHVLVPPSSHYTDFLDNDLSVGRIGPDWSDLRTLNRWPSKHGMERADKVATRVGYSKTKKDLKN